MSSRWSLCLPGPAVAFVIGDALTMLGALGKEVMVWTPGYSLLHRSPGMQEVAVEARLTHSGFWAVGTCSCAGGVDVVTHCVGVFPFLQQGGWDQRQEAKRS